MFEKKLIDKAMDAIHGIDDHPLSSQWLVAESPETNHELVGRPSYHLEYCVLTKGCRFRWLGSNKTVQIHPVVLSYFGANWEAACKGGDKNATLNCFTDLRHKDGATFRAHPNYQAGGPWYDWAMVRFVDDDEIERDFPCRLLLFYYHSNSGSTTAGGGDGGGGGIGRGGGGDKSDDVTSCDGSEAEESGINVVVQATTYLSALGSDRQRKEKLAETHLCTRWLLDTRQGRDKVHELPQLYSVPVESIQGENIMVVEEHPGLCESWIGKRYVWHVQDRRKKWPNKFPLSFKLD
jgi:hypothetical protein